MYDELINRLRSQCSGYRKECEDCNADGNCRSQMENEAADAVEELSREKESLAKSVNEASEILRRRWIPVTERLPEHGWYLAYGPTIKMEVLHFHSVEEVWSSERYYNIEVTHWMPLPQAPKEEGE